LHGVPRLTRRRLPHLPKIAKLFFGGKTQSSPWRARAACFENTVQALYKYVVPKPKSECGKVEQLGVSFAAGYIAGVFCAVVSHPADNLVSKLNSQKGATVGSIVNEMGWRAPAPPRARRPGAPRPAAAEPPAGSGGGRLCDGSRQRPWCKESRVFWSLRACVRAHGRFVQLLGVGSS
jgi:hypothetical protein